MSRADDMKALVHRGDWAAIGAAALFGAGTPEPCFSSSGSSGCMSSRAV